jgi:hypothetical protein
MTCLVEIRLLFGLLQAAYNCVITGGRAKLLTDFLFEVLVMAIPIFFSVLGPDLV